MPESGRTTRLSGPPSDEPSNKRRQGVTIPSARTRTPPAGYKAAAPPRRGPFSGQEYNGPRFQRRRSDRHSEAKRSSQWANG